MKKVEINEITFKKLIDGVKHCVATDESRPILQYIQVNVKNDTIIVYALDGFRAGRVEVKNTNPIDEEFTCYIKPLSIKVSKQGINPVIIECTDDKTFIEVITEYGVLRYGFDDPIKKGKGNYVDIEKIYNNARLHDRELGIDPRYVIDALKSLKGCDRYAVFESKENNKEAFIIKAKTEDIINEQLILPVRLQI